jgi:H+/Cl- antiporter ClcA
MNGGLILLLQNTISSIIIGTVIGFITYFFIFSLLKIDYDRSEQMLSILNINVFFYILINVILFSIIFILYIFLNKEKEKEEDYQKICNNYSFKKMSSETFFQSLSFFCNLTMIICIKIQRKLIFGNDGNFVSRNFNMEEIIDQNNLLAKIRNDETYKFNKSLFIKYIYKVLICLAIAIITYLLFAVIKYLRNKYYYIVLSILAYTLPINLLVIFLFLFGKYLFIKLGLEIYNDSE